jgi:hypothetical protein
MPLNYSILVQTTAEIGKTENSPSVSMWPYLLQCDQTGLIPQISIYTQSGDTRERARILYMNAVALGIWSAMGKAAAVVGEVHRPPKSALLIFGMPFSE